MVDFDNVQIGAGLCGRRIVDFLGDLKGGQGRVVRKWFFSCDLKVGQGCAVGKRWIFGNRKIGQGCVVGKRWILAIVKLETFLCSL